MSNTRRFEATVQLDSGLIVPKSAAAGLVLASDASGDATWVDHTPPGTQIGFEGRVTNTPITATINSTTGAITLTNWPAGDGYWCKLAGGQLSRGVAPSAPSGANAIPGVLPASGHYLYAYAVLAPPTTGDGNSGTAQITGASSSVTSAALAAAEQAAQGSITTGSLAYGLIVWDGIILNTSGSYSLVTGGSGATLIPAGTGRDRRPWARGYSNEQLSMTEYNTTATSFTPIDSTNLIQRVECMGVPLLLKFTTDAWNPNTPSTTWRFCFYEDGAEIVDSYFEFNLSGYEIPFNWDYYFTPAAGSHLFAPYWYSSNGTEILTGPSGSGSQFVVQEDITQNANNGTA